MTEVRKLEHKCIIKPKQLAGSGAQWKNRSMHKCFFDKLGVKLGHKSMEDWYNVTQVDIFSNGGNGLLTNYYGNSPSKALGQVYPQHQWELWRFKQVPVGYWTNTHHRIAFFDRLFITLGYKCLEDWYNVTQEQIHMNGGRALLYHYYNNSPAKALQCVYPQHKWDPQKFKNKPILKRGSNTEQRRVFLSHCAANEQGTPKGFWKNNRNQLIFADWLYTQLGYKSMDDWYSVTIEDINKYGGIGLLDHYNCSPSMALQSIYPGHDWKLWKFKQVPKRYWEDSSNHKRFFDTLFYTLGYKLMDDWYNVTVEEIASNGGLGLLDNYYSSSPSKALQSTYPDHNWKLWRFKTVPMGYWNEFMKERKTVINMIEWLTGKLSIKYLDDWYRTSLVKIRKWVQIASAKKLGEMLQLAYPQHQWDVKLFDRIGIPIKSSQHELVVAMQQLFPKCSMSFTSLTVDERLTILTHPFAEVEEDYQHPKMIHSSGHNMELDVFIESLKLAAEYQGEQHYKAIYWTGGDFEIQWIRDEEKRRACKQAESLSQFLTRVA